jgi:lysyl-tRNA synthetase class 1
MRVKLLPISEAEKVASTIPSSIADIFKELYERFQTLDLWSEEKIKEAFIAVTSRLGEDLVKSFYTYFYRLLSGKDSGPRAAPLLALLGRELSLKYILLATKTHI